MSEFPRPSTESQLREWRQGQVGAERLAAALLHLDGFVEIDPQAPLVSDPKWSEWFREVMICRIAEIRRRS